MNRYSFVIITSAAVLLLTGCCNCTHEFPSGNPVDVSMSGMNGNNYSGTAHFDNTSNNTQSLITITIPNVSPTDRRLAFLQYGSCDKLDFTILYPLSDLVGGRSTTTYNLPLGALLGGGPGDGSGRGPGGMASPGTQPGPTASWASFSVTIWKSYTTTGNGSQLMSCGSHLMGT